LQPDTSRLPRNALGRARWDDTKVHYWTRGDGRALSISNSEVTQGGPLSASLFNIVVDCLAQEWLIRLRETIELEEDKVERLMVSFLAIFYVDNAYLASRDPNLLQKAMNIID
jgi:hypothetical protein